MHPEDIRKMSELMSTGVANIQKIHSERTMARTRLIFVANTKEGKHLNSYPYGCNAITEIMGGHNEDVARMDFAIAIANDISIEDIEKLKEAKRTVKTFNSDACHTLVMWAWSRKPSDISWEAGAEKHCVVRAMEQVNTYSMNIPLVPSAEHPVKLARISAAVAAMFYSTDVTGEKLIIKKDHVEWAYNFLDAIYADPAMGFKAYSNIQKTKECKLEKKNLEALGVDQAIAELFLATDQITPTFIEHAFNVAREEARVKLSYLLKQRALATGGKNGSYQKTAGFVRVLAHENYGKEKPKEFDF
jgi:hypothetical protein